MPLFKNNKIRAWCMYDWANSAYVTTVAVAVLPAYFASRVVPPEGAAIFGTTIPAQALWGYMMSATAVVMLLTGPLLGAIADHTGRHRSFLAFAALAGSFFSGLLVFSGPGRVAWTMALFFLAHTAFLAGNVFYDSFLPHIAPGRMDDVSGRGFAYGYLGGGLQFALALGLVAGHEALGLSQDLAARLAMLMAALWWGGFALIPVLGLPARTPGGADQSAGGMLRAGLTRLREAPRQAKKSRGLLLFLLAFLCYNDGIQTTIAMATIYGTAELRLSTTVLMLTLLIIQFVAAPGSWIFGRLAGRFGPKAALLIALGIWTGLVLAASRIDSATDYLLLGVGVGSVLGGSQALSRSIFARLIPAGASAEFFGWFSIFNRLSSVAGPFLFGLLTQTTGSGRVAVFALAGFFIAGMGLLRFVPLPRESAEAPGA
jgi:UMF1 family MFS transporter